MAAKRLAPNLQLGGGAQPTFPDEDQHGPEAPQGRCDATPADLTQGLKFFGNRICPFAHRSWWAALEVGAPIEYVHVDMGSRHAKGPNNKPWWYVNDVSPLATVPTLVDEGVPYFAISGTFEVDPVFEHVVSRGATVLGPTSPAEQRKVKMFVAWLGGRKVVPLMYQLLASRDAAKSGALKQRLTALLREVSERLAAAGPGPFFLGDRLSQADMAIAPFLDRFEATLGHYRRYELLPRDDPRRARLRAMMDACRERPHFRTTSQAPGFWVKSYKGYGGAPDPAPAL